MKSHQVKRFIILDERTSEGFAGLETMILVKGTDEYAAILKRAFPNLPLDGPYPNDNADFDWFLIGHATDEQQAGIRILLQTLMSALSIQDELDECFALSQHMILAEEGGFVRTPIAQMVREAKPYDAGWNAGNKDKAGKLATMLVDFIRIHPTYSRVPFIVAVPPSNPNKRFDLPSLLVEHIAVATGKNNVTAKIQKIRPTQPMKNVATLAEKAANIKDAFRVEPAALNGNPVILVDDIYQTGSSINEVGRALKTSGVTQVLA